MKKVLLISLLVCGIATANAATTVTNNVTGVLGQEVGDLTSLTKEEKTCLMTWIKDHKILVTVATVLLLGGTASGLCHYFGDKLAAAEGARPIKKLLAGTANVIAKPADWSVSGSKATWDFTTNGRAKYVSGSVLVLAVLAVVYDLAISKDPIIKKIYKKLAGVKKAKKALPVIA